MLRALGISDGDERTYRAFLPGGELTAPEVAKVLAVTVAQAQRSIARLTALGILRRTTRGHYQAVNPQTALVPLLRQRMFEAETTLDAARGEVEAITVSYREGQLRGNPGNLLEVLSGRAVVVDRLEELNRSASSHIWVLDRPPYLGQPDGTLYSNEDEHAITRAWIERGVEVRSIYCPESMERPGRYATLLELAAIGEQSRLLPALPFKLHIIDKRIALIPLSGGTYDGMAVLHPSGLLDAVIELYEAYWARAEPMTGSMLTQDQDLNQDDVLLLGMLKAGLKDQAIARQLGMSTRTATRRVAVVLAKLGVQTRFQAGVRATVQGLI
ncbi:hypothetical protein [Micromonospora sp. U21]|uniref:hypothetical protein n=1 Tax=Micromonospora sp. U21 TaxID=2824899 RepID=UPI001B381113|nr:hypothetical protein [Micromonospora sp. U21]MBQ0907028.1 hypothetical protein [Micromonospora sp. U21]